MNHPQQTEIELSYDPDTGEIRAATGRRMDVPTNSGYRIVYAGNRILKAHRVAWYLVHGEWPKAIDHINGDPGDNRLDNLRIAGQAENMRNASLYSNNKSGVPGVRWRADKGRWVASIKVDGRHISLGSHLEFDAAVAARKNAETKYGFHPNHGR